jgi:hypothetical protein
VSVGIKFTTMSRRSKRNKNGNGGNTNDNDRQQPEQHQGNSVAAHVRDRQRAVAEREAARLARPERSRRSILAHANRKLSGVSSTPLGFLASSSRFSKDETEQEEWCGPFSVARQMIAKREEAKRKREEDLEGEQEEHHPLDALMDEVNVQHQRKMHPSMQWKSNLSRSGSDGTSANGKGVVVTSTYAKRQRRIDLSKSDKSCIPSLFQLTVNFIVDNFEHVESLGDVGNEVRVAIAKELVGRNQLDGKALEALVEPATMETLEIVDCAGIPQDTMASILASITGLRYLLLTHAGRCFGTKSVKALLEKNTGAELCCLSIAGAYLLCDEDVAKLIEDHDSTLQSIAFQSCPLLGDKFANAIRNNSRLGENLLELSLQDMSFSVEQLTVLANSKDALKGIRSLTLKSITGLTDEILAQILELAHESLDSLNIGFNYSLTDSTLSSIRQYSSLRLKALVLDGIKGFTAPGLEALFTHPLEGLPPPPKLKILKLGSIDYEAVTDELLKLVTASSSATTTTDLTSDPSQSSQFASYRSLGRPGGLIQVDVQGSTLVSDQMLEQLVETSANTLETINLSYCPLISDRGVGYLVSKLGNQLTKMEVWGCAQLTDEFFDGHDRVEDGTLEIIGAWMKKSGTRSLR